MSQAYSTRPSELLGIDNTVKAYYIDQACFRFGSRVDSEMSKAETKTKDIKSAERARAAILDREVYSGTGTGVSSQPSGRFRDPALR